LSREKYEDAVRAYKEALKLNPADADTKYNLAYANAKLKNKNDGGGKDNQQKKDENQKQQDQKNKEQKQDEQNKDQQSENKDQQKDGQKKQGQQPKFSKKKPKKCFRRCKMKSRRPTRKCSKSK
jgi:Ca-activated chloride channel family protein